MNDELVYFDLKTVALLRETLDDAWALLQPAQKAKVSRILLAERILKAAAKGERSRETLIEEAFTALSETEKA